MTSTEPVAARHVGTRVADAPAPFGVEITRLPLTPAVIVDLVRRPRS